MCTVFTDQDEQFSKLIIQPEITNGGEEIEIQITSEQARKLEILERISIYREN